MNQETVKIFRLIQKAPADRSRSQIEDILPYVAKRSELLQALIKERRDNDLFELLKYCQLQTFNQDDVIIKQGNIGDSFYIVLTGQVSVYIDTSKTEEPEIVDDVDKKDQKSAMFEEIDALVRSKVKMGRSSSHVDVGPSMPEEAQFSRSKLGKFIMQLDAGKSFGEVALLNENAERNASIVADMDGMALLVIEKHLYDRTLKERQMADYKDRREFVNSHPYFSSWSNRFKHLLEMSLIKLTYSYDNIIVKQGEPVDGLYFIISGQAKVTLNPKHHKAQYPHLLKDQGQTEVRRLAQHSVYIRRTEGYKAAEQRANHRLIDTTFLNEGEVFGALELSTSLSTYSGTLRCTSQVVALHINSKNVERLIIKKNPKTMEMIREQCFKTITDMVSSKSCHQVPLYQIIYETLIHEEETPKLRNTCKPKDTDDKSFLQSQLVQMFIEGKMQLMEPLTPDSVYFRYKSAERRSRALSAREQILKEKREKSLDGKLRALSEARKKAFLNKRARSRRQLSNATLDEFVASAPEPEPRVQTPAALLSDYTIQQLSQRYKRLNTANSRLETVSEENLDVLSDEQTPRKLAISKVTTSKPTEEEYQTPLFDFSDEDTMATTIFKVMETIKYRKNTKSSTRPHSAPHNMRLASNILINTSAHLHSGIDSDDFDADTSDSRLKSLELRMKDFHDHLTKLNSESPNTTNSYGAKPIITKLKRFQIQNGDTPVAGGTVLVQKKPCKYQLASLAETADHHHVKRYIIPKLRNY